MQAQIPIIDHSDDRLKHHPTYSYRLIESESTLSQEIKLAVLQHHERLDGSGYPLGLKSDKIHIYARIISVCDAYYDMSSRAQFQGKRSVFHVIHQLMASRFTKLDPIIIQTLVDTMASLSIGVSVKLSNQKVGKIIFIDDKKPQYPIVQLDETGDIMALEHQRELTMTDIRLDW